MQSSAIIVQGLANDIVKGSVLNRLVKEVGLSLLMDLYLCTAHPIWIYYSTSTLSLTIAGAMMG